MSIRVYKDSRHKWRWQLKADNGRIIGASTQGYVRKSAAKANAVMVANEIQLARKRLRWEYL